MRISYASLSSHLRKSLLSIPLFFFLVYAPSVFSEKATSNFEKYNICASHKPKFVWFRVAKVATRSTYEIFRQNNAVYAVDGYQVPFNPKDYTQHFKFAFVRNPWDRVVSCYVNKIGNPKHPCHGKDFDYFVDWINGKDLTSCDAHIRLQTRLFPAKHVNFIGRLESFDDDIRYVAKVLGYTINEVPRINSTQQAREHYSKFYTERTKQIIAKKYKDDIEAFGYKFETK